jgi:hypothetical protein
MQSQSKVSIQRPGDSFDLADGNRSHACGPFLVARASARLRGVSATALSQDFFPSCTVNARFCERRGNR